MCGRMPMCVHWSSRRKRSLTAAQLRRRRMSSLQGFTIALVGVELAHLLHRAPLVKKCGDLSMIWPWNGLARVRHATELVNHCVREEVIRSLRKTAGECHAPAPSAIWYVTPSCACGRWPAGVHASVPGRAAPPAIVRTRHRSAIGMMTVLKLNRLPRPKAVHITPSSTGLGLGHSMVSVLKQAGPERWKRASTTMADLPQHRVPSIRLCFLPLPRRMANV